MSCFSLKISPGALTLIYILQAQQDVPAWLEEIAEGAISAGFQGGGGRFGGRDTRRGMQVSNFDTLKLFRPQVCGQASYWSVVISLEKKLT